MFQFLKAFRVANGGAVTIDWIVLVVGVCALGASAASVIFDASSSLSQAVFADLNLLGSGGASIATEAD